MTGTDDSVRRLLPNLDAQMAPFRSGQEHGPIDEETEGSVATTPLNPACLRVPAYRRGSCAIHGLACLSCISSFTIQDLYEFDAAFEYGHKVDPVHQD